MGEVKDGHGCWSCSLLRESSLPHSSSPSSFETTENSQLTLQIDDSENSKYVSLVYKWCKKRGLKGLDIQTTQEGLVLKTPESELKGPNTIVFSLARATSPDISAQLLGDSPESQAEVTQWLSLQNTPDIGQLSAFSRIEFLNVFLGPKAVLVGSGTKISLADLGTFSGIHDSVAKLTPAERAKYPNFMRWFDYIQSKGDEEGIYEHVPLEKPKFSPPAPEPKVLPSENARKGAPTTTSSEASTNVTTEKSSPSVTSTLTSKVSVPNEPSSTPPIPPASLTAPTSEGKKEEEKEKVTEKEKEKKEKKEKPPAQKKEVDSSVSVLNIRVGEIKKVWKHPGADTLYVEEIDIGEGSVRQVVSGLAKFLTEEEMLGRRVLVLANVKAGKVRDVVSSGLVLCASNEDHSQCQPVSPPPSASIGERIKFEGHNGEPEEVLNPKKKQLEKILPDLRTDENGVAKFQQVPFMTSGGPCTSTILKAIIK